MFVLMLAVGLGTAAQAQPSPSAPAGFTTIFNGKDLQGWRGRPGGGGVFSPYVEARFTAEERAKAQQEWNEDRDKHWSVKDGILVSDGHGVHLATDRPYADFEFLVEYRFMGPNGDSGIYLRSYPQVQLWDVDNVEAHKHGSDKGSGGLWNNNDDNPGKWPLVKADKPHGQWNSLKVKMVDQRVWVELNGKVTVDGQILNNFFDRSLPLLPSGAIELQTHGTETQFRNIFIREIGQEEAKRH